jgi:phage terminase small subunit
MKKQLTVPAIGQTFSRDLMPQIGPESIKDFQKYLKSKGIGYNMAEMPTGSLKATQSEFDGAKILQLMGVKNNDPIITSNDDHVLDGHHRWLANHNSGKEKTKACQVDLPILDLVHAAKEYRNSLNEDISHKEFEPMMKRFSDFAADYLKIKSKPPVNLIKDFDATSFGGYQPGHKRIRLHTKNRHPMDIFRTLAHELVHHKQHEDGRIKDPAEAGKTGSPFEDEANAVAGRIMREYGKKNPKAFELTSLTEDKMKISEACWKGYYQPKKKKLKPKGGKFVPNCVPMKEMKNYEGGEAKQRTSTDLEFTKFLEETDYRTDTSLREWGKTSLANMYKRDTPGQHNESLKMGGEKPYREYEGMGRVTMGNLQGQGIYEAIRLRKKQLEEDGVLDTASGAVGLPVADSIGPEFGVAKSPSLIGGLTGVAQPITGFGPAGSIYPYGTYGIAESVIDWMNKPETQARFTRKYGELAEQKLIEAAEALSGGDSTMIGRSNTSKDEIYEGSPAWQRKEGKNPEGGLNKKGVESYRREHPGSKLSTAVTTEPSKLKKGSKKAKRRLSFCRRMKGMKAKLTSAKTARDPDSRINKSLRKWNCEE